jgi:sigma-B regulation protein RsbU (phosphoserine phosphatase)
MGFRSALFYIIALAAFWVGLFVFGLKTLGMIPHNMVTRWLLQWASLLQVVLLSLGLADRINILRKELQDLNVNLENIVEERTAELNTTMVSMEKKERAIQKEFELAGNIQQGILPVMPFYYGGIKVDAYYKSMGKVGGDFYDIFHMKGGYLGILVADASGHGMPAAFITALAKISFAEAIQTYLFPSDIFKMVNNELLETIKTDDFVTAFFIVISPT